MSSPVPQAPVTSLLSEARSKSAQVEHTNGNGAHVNRSIDTEPTFQHWIYDMVIWTFSVVFDLFFREIRPRGAYRIPRHGPIIFVAAPHANQFVDPIMLMRQIRNEAGRRISFLAAEKSMRLKFVGTMARSVSSIPVARTQDLATPGTGLIYISDKEKPLIIKDSLGHAEIENIASDVELTLRRSFKDEKAIERLLSGPSKFKTAPKVDQSQVYKKVFERLNDGGCIGIFPEGGSHDRPDLLPLKAGVAIMALGALDNNPECDIKIVPCGMNYFHPHKFRSRAVIEFGPPLSVPKELVKMYSEGNKRESIQQLLEMIHSALLAVTVTSPDYDTLMVIQAARRLYEPAHKKIPLSLVIEMNRRLVIGYTHYKDDPRIIHLRDAVANYNKQLRHLGILDHQVEYATLSISRIFGKLVYRLLKLFVLALGALPGAILFAPVFIATKKISKKKAAEALKASTVKIAARDVVATWKILVALGLAPTLYWFYALLATWATWKYDLVPQVRPVWLVTLAAMIVFPAITYAALRIGEIGMDIFKSLKPLVACLNPNNMSTIAKLRITREELSKEVTEMINSLGPDVFPEFDSHRLMQS
ncbi:hypothetical protein POJ06DRAFT_268129 [Lipomyces tetrasporus]|uniref:Phospholipid/glycerol acyltransferase domain-containing protein n=1 Tax=Lipomyces tetrasporus TaxID=54092 RepID=A0AAD7VTU8_9ASCO|nr:uncharacterized protein POJ06DRAFT_268129 [Lipomyces tetrasporus]KAJ8100540.1 hypothetical protein POJ06DRAFT_268129 [Lipomyces tetrasporus]